MSTSPSTLEKHLPATPARARDLSQTPIIATDTPIMYEDEGQEEMGDTDLHTRCCGILRYGVAYHLREEPHYRVFSDLNVYYSELDLAAYVSPDTCAFLLEKLLPVQVTSYRIGKDGPAPLLTMEVLSKRSYQQQDTSNKPRIYQRLGVAEYVLVDVTGEFLPQRLLLKRLEDGEWTDHQDEDGGVTSQLGFRIILDDDGMIRVVDAATGRRYFRPEELADAEEALQELEEKWKQAEQKSRQIELEKQKAEKERRQIELEKQKAEKERQKAEELVRKLEKEIKRLRDKDAD